MEKLSIILAGDIVLIIDWILNKNNLYIILIDWNGLTMNCWNKLG